MLINGRLLIFAPSFAKAFSVSYSQFVPEKTGANTFGCAIPCFLEMIFLGLTEFNVESISTVNFSFSIVGKRFSNVLVLAANNFSIANSHYDDENNQKP